ncbi:ATP-dependent DNA ligase [Ramlibacter sp. AN1133]|uniref:ATP-dependent DNA ligase n=1 Tax=Ramlibacter sp. AN1133 TaxID=3133429 RepID=UPI0030C3A43A
MQAPQRLFKPFTADDWVYEVKWDGWRCRAGFGGGVPVEMFTKSGTPCAAWFPEVVEILSALPGGYWAVDGELCVLDEAGRADFERMQARAMRRRWVPGAQVTFMVFDLMVAEGRSVMELPLLERKALLREALAGASKTSVLYQGELPARAELLSQVAEPLAIEGFMAKHVASTYRSGERSDWWRKIKTKSFLSRVRQRFGGRPRRQ